MTKKATYIVLEGCEGVGKTTQTQELTKYLKSKGHKVLQTKEPGTPLSPLTMELRNIMLNMDYDAEMTQTSREFVSQAIRSVHLERVIKPALEEYDFIVQDRGILSGLAYGEACGNNIDWLESLAFDVTHCLMSSPYKLYDSVIYLTSNNVKQKLEIAKNAKQEFENGDAIEAKGGDFIMRVNRNMDAYSKWFDTVTINVDGNSIEEVLSQIVGGIEG
jgi:dTMP kinase